jgi:hypothetical protein
MPIEPADTASHHPGAGPARDLRPAQLGGTLDRDTTACEAGRTWIPGVRPALFARGALALRRAITRHGAALRHGLTRGREVFLGPVVEIEPGEAE